MGGHWGLGLTTTASFATPAMTNELGCERETFVGVTKENDKSQLHPRSILDTAVGVIRNAKREAASARMDMCVPATPNSGIINLICVS